MDDRPVNPNRIRKSIGTEHTYEQDLAGLREILYALKNVEGELIDRIRRNSALGRTLTLKVKFEDFEQITRSRSLYDFYTPSTIHSVSVELAGAIDYANRGVRLLGLTLSNFENPDELDAYQLSIEFD